MSQHSSWKQRRTGAEAILDLIARDAGFRQRLRANPTDAMLSIGGMNPSDDVPEVAGYAISCPKQTCCRDSGRLSYRTL